jgi:transketolase
VTKQPVTEQDQTDIERLAVNVIKGLAMDAPEAAKSGHQGTAMALAPLAHVLYTRVLRHDPAAPDWPDRDRFVLSAGHASILLYSALHLSGYDLTLDDLRAFRQWESRTPGHPEVHHTPGVEVTTGPLGQGFANGVGMAIAERMLRTRFGSEITDHRVYAICSDGDLMEGVSHEAASLAGHLGLGRLIYVYDDNSVTIDGRTDLTLSDDPGARFRSYGWHVDEVGEVADDLDALEAALNRAAEEEDRPSLIILQSHIASPSPEWTDHPKAHGNPFDADEITRTKELLGLPADQSFWVPEEVRGFYREAVATRAAAHAEWEERFNAWDGDKATWDACQRAVGLPNWEQKLPTWSAGQSIATRVASNECLNALVDVVPGLVGGGADLTGNSGSTVSDAGVQSAVDPAGRQIYFGVREHAMGSVLNGLALHGGALPVGGTFLVFSDYMRPAVRLAAISQAKVIYSWSHDSVGVGEDGPTHQPVEHVASLRAIPGLRVIRPADANEVTQAWKVAIDLPGPTAMILSRQSIPVLDGTATGDLARGAYVLVDPADNPRLVLIGTGSEVHVCVDAAELLADQGIPARVVSMPSWELFADQTGDYRRRVLPPGIPRLAVEAGTSFGWERWAEASVSIDRFGVSAPGHEVLERLGFTPRNVAARATDLVSGTEQS